MRKIIYALAYLIALVAGICLLVFNHQAVEESQPVLKYVMMGVGIVFIIPGLFFLIASLRPHRDANGVIVSRPWFSTGTAIISLVWGVLLLCMPSGLLGNLNISLGVSLIIVSLAQIVWIVKGRRVNGAPAWLYIIPLATIAAGVWVMLLETDYQDPGKEHTIGSIISGAAFILWGINGFLSLPRRKKTAADIEKEARRLAKEQERAAKEEAKEAKARLAQAKANTEAARQSEEAARKAAEEAQQKLKTGNNEEPKQESKSESDLSPAVSDVSDNTLSNEKTEDSETVQKKI